MNAYFLCLPDGIQTSYSACGICGKLALSKEVSEKCCTCLECGKPLSSEDRKVTACLYHRPCERERNAKIDRYRLEKAEILDDYSGPVYFEGLTGSYGDGYFEDVDELAETLNDESDLEYPEFAHTCVKNGIYLDIGSVLENLTSDMFEDAMESLSGVDELNAAVAAFNKANSDFSSWEVDYKHKVALSKRQAEAV